MKTILRLSLISMLIFFGCDQQSDLISSFESIESGSSSDILPDIPVEIELKRLKYVDGADNAFIPLNLPASEIPNLGKSKVIDGKHGGIIKINYEFHSDDNNEISIRAQLDIPKDAFDGEQLISMMLHNDIGAVSFYPHTVFDKPVKFSMKYKGIDLSTVNPDSVDFIFQDYDGSTEQINYKNLIVKPDKGELELKNAELHHFSRYGWIR